MFDWMFFLHFSELCPDFENLPGNWKIRYAFLYIIQK